MMVTCHSKTLLSSTSPAENPSTGCLARSAPNTYHKKTTNRSTNQSAEEAKKKSSGNGCTGTKAGRTSELLLEEEARLAGGSRHERRSVAGLGFCGARSSRDAVTQIDGRRGRLIYRREVRSSEKMGIGKGASRVGVGENEAVVDWNAGRSLPLALSLLSYPVGYPIYYGEL
jgi:hypothetical protein